MNVDHLVLCMSFAVTTLLAYSSSGGDKVDPSFEPSSSYELSGQNTRPAECVKREKFT